jgi:hypothetical protein
MNYRRRFTPTIWCCAVILCLSYAGLVLFEVPKLVCLAIAALGGLVGGYAVAMVCRTPCAQCGRMIWIYPWVSTIGHERCCDLKHPTADASDARTRFVITTLGWASGSIALCYGLLVLSQPFQRIDVISSGPGDSDTCYRKDFATVPNGSGDVAVLRAVACPAESVFDRGLGFFVVFVHRFGEANSRDNLVLQYLPTAPWPQSAARFVPSEPVLPGMPGPVPHASWLSPNVLSVIVPDHLEQLLVLKQQIDGHEIKYDFAAGPPPSPNPELPQGFREI